MVDPVFPSARCCLPACRVCVAHRKLRKILSFFFACFGPSQKSVLMLACHNCKGTSFQDIPFHRSGCNRSRLKKHTKVRVLSNLLHIPYYFLGRFKSWVLLNYTSRKSCKILAIWFKSIENMFHLYSSRFSDPNCKYCFS